MNALVEAELHELHPSKPSHQHGCTGMHFDHSHIGADRLRTTVDCPHKTVNCAQMPANRFDNLADEDA